MPFALVRSGDGWKVRDDQGKLYSEEPLSRKRAVAQMRALYTHTPDEDKKEVVGPMGVNASGPGGAGAIGLESKKPDRYESKEIVKKEDSMDSTSEKHGQHNQTAHGYRFGSHGGVAVGKFRGMKPSERQAYIDAAKKRKTDPQLVNMLETYHRSWGKKTGNEMASSSPSGKPASTGKKPAKPKKPADAGARRNAQSAVNRLEGELSRARDLLKRTDASLGKRDNPSLRASRNGLAKDVHDLEAKIAEAKRKYQLKEALGVLLSDDYSGEASLECSGNLSVFKDSNGKYRWILQSSNAFRDRDNEIVSTKALEADVEATDESGVYGPLRWWHCKGYDLGDCDFRMVHGRTLIESGTFRSNEIGERIKEHAGRLQVSIGFNHPPDEPDSEGVFHTIRTFERSLLPAGKAANPFTRVVVKGDEPMATKEEKLKALRTLGIDPTSVLQQAEETEKELDSKGIAYKENAPESEADPVETEAEEVKETAETEAAPDPEAEKAKKPAPKKVEEDEPEDEPEDEEEEVPVIGNMGVKEFSEMLTKALSEAVAPVMKMAHSHDPKEGEKEAGERAALKELIDAQQAKIDGLTAQIAASEKSLHESQSALTAANTAIAAAGQTMKELNGRLADLEGSRPRALTEKGYDAAADDETVIDDERAKELGAPVADPAASTFMDFTQNFLLGGNQ